MTDQENQQWGPVFWIAGALAGWGLLLAWGAYLAPVGEVAGQDHRKLWVVAATIGGFLLLWGLVLGIRAQKLRQQSRKKTSPDR